MSGAAHDLARRLWAGDLSRGGRLLDALLAPAEALYRAGITARNTAYERGVLRTHRSTVPTISVGNLAVGGTGKTPFAHWLAVVLRERGRRPAVLHGGYAADEPELHRRWAPDIPVVTGRDRVAAARRAVEAGADVLVLDDAFQHRRLQRDVDLVLVSAERWSPRRRLLPRGPWRESGAALQRADAIVVTRKTAGLQQARDVAASAAAESGIPTVIVRLDAARWLRSGSAAARDAEAHAFEAGHTRPPDGPAVLVSGIADPDLFAENARRAGATIAERLVFGDHYAYGASEAAEIARRAAGRPIVTTEKDWTKLERWLDRESVWLLAQDITVEDGAGLLDESLDRVLA
jgi:tetraacyldisaccharide 4'-kinase